MNCLAMLAHCHRTGTRIQISNHYSHLSNANANAVHVMDASLYDRSPVRTVITSDAMRELLQTAAFVHDGGGANGDANQCCPITQDEFAEGDAVLVLPCGHAFMQHAIQTWLEKESGECPVCRHALPSHKIIIIENK